MYKNYNIVHDILLFKCTLGYAKRLSYVSFASRTSFDCINHSDLSRHVYGTVLRHNNAVANSWLLTAIEARDPYVGILHVRANEAKCI